MRRAILRGVVLILVAALLLCGIASAIIFSIRQTEAKEEELSRIAHVMSRQFDPAQHQNVQANDFAKMLSGVRITIIDPDGNVTGDSTADYRTMENHSDRPEIMEASATKAAVSVRQSNTIGKMLMYAVVKTADGHYIRLAEEYGGIAAGFASLFPAVLFAALLAMVTAFFLANKFSSSVIVPIEALNNSLIGVKDGSVTLNPEEYPYDELRDMAGKINALAADISMHIGRLQEEREKIGFILDSMKEGFILLDEKQGVLLMNESACAYLKCTKNGIGQNVLHCTQDMRFLDAVQSVIQTSRNQSIDMSVNGKTVEAEFTVVSGQHGLGGGLIVTMTDVTENRSSANMRRDFFASASHELKTPITSIKGSVELLCADIPLDDVEQKKLLTRIGLETERMHGLINDIIMINRMESGEITEEKERIELSFIVRECCDEAMPLIGQGGITMNIILEKAFIYASRKNLHELISNLIINAVKYNKPDGVLDVSLKRSDEKIVLSVRNDGEPIPPEHQHRVFERFYRVDKGRSKTVGGTGLGLSIVKHIVDGLGGTIQLESNAKNGTRFTVTMDQG